MISQSSYPELKEIGDYLGQVPYDVVRRQLYNALELYEGFDPDDEDSYHSCYDGRVYQYYLAHGKRAESSSEALARSLHDHHIGVALDDFLDRHNPYRSVGIMGGHALLRTDLLFREIVSLSKRLTELGFLMISGGGPGAMEATHLGAWLAGRTREEVEAVLNRLAAAPSFRDKGWLSTAFQVLTDFPQTRYESLGIPTWLYGHEPSTPFATHIAKLFENSIREDNLLTFSYGGIIYTPGSAGTMQEIFQEAVQNHYLSFGISSPMVFMGKKFWTEELPIYPMLQTMMKEGKYKNLLLSLSDDSDEIIQELVHFGARHGQ